LAIIREHAPFDAVLMDCQMPIMDGYTATTELRAHEAPLGRRTPVIALTANALDQDAKRCLASGMDAHLGKPYTFVQLAEALHAWCMLGAWGAQLADTLPRRLGLGHDMRGAGKLVGR
jgi:CheY-like chemotaxis protein